MKLKSLLERLLSEDVDEAAVAVAQARSEQLALAIFKRDFLRLVLYKPAVIVKQIEEIEETHGNSTKGDAIASIEFPTHIVGQMTIGSHRRGTSEVLGSAAEQGYGPLLYDIGLSIIYPNFLISDRRSVSDSAKKYGIIITAKGQT